MCRMLGMAHAELILLVTILSIFALWAVPVYQNPMVTTDMARVSHHHALSAPSSAEIT